MNIWDVLETASQLAPTGALLFFALAILLIVISVLFDVAIGEVDVHFQCRKCGAQSSCINGGLFEAFRKPHCFFCGRKMKWSGGF